MVDAEHVHTIGLGIDPEEAAKIPAGRHTIRAVLDLPFWPSWRWHGRVTSDVVVVTVSARAAGISPTDPGEQQRLIGSARFYLRASRFEDAQRVARQLLEHDPRSADGHLLLGDALNGLHRDQEALSAYRSVLLLSTDKGQNNPPPIYLMERMHEVEERLGHQ
ncbi:MAG: tetratricopeptide repeat protein [Deltaproteobacteria bacterium]|nr:tetratricopeptide repeat protein [Deltaproteobacteria bacterium]